MLHTHRNFYTETLLHTEKLLHTASFYTQNLLHIASFFRKKFLNRETFLYIITAGIAAPKLDLDAKAKNRPFRSTFYKDFSRKITSAKIEKKHQTSADKSLSQPWCSHSNTIYEIQLHKRLVLRMQPRCQATLTQPLQCVLQHHVANLHVSTHVATSEDDNHAAMPMRSATTASRNAYNYAHRNNHSLQST